MNQVLREARCVIADLLKSIEAPATDISVWYDLSAVDFMGNAKSCVAKLDTVIEEGMNSRVRFTIECIATQLEEVLLNAPYTATPTVNYIRKEDVGKMLALVSQLRTELNSVLEFEVMK